MSGRPAEGHKDPTEWNSFRWVVCLPVAFFGFMIGCLLFDWLFMRVYVGESDLPRNHPWLYAIPWFLASFIGGLVAPKYRFVVSAILSTGAICWTIASDIPYEWKPISNVPCIVAGAISVLLVGVVEYFSIQRRSQRLITSLRLP